MEISLPLEVKNGMLMGWLIELGLLGSVLKKVEFYSLRGGMGVGSY
jgi:hypothetical protein